MAYKFQLGAATMSGSLTQEGDIAAQEISGTIGEFTHLTCSANSLTVGGVTISATEIAVLDAFGDHAITIGDDSIVFYDHGTGAFRRDSVGDVMAAVAGDGLEQSGNKLQLDLQNNGGLEINSNEVRVKVKTNAGLVRDGDGMSVKLDNNGGLEFAGGAADIRLKAAVAGDGLAHSSGVLSVNVDDATIETNGDALRIKAGGLEDSHMHNNVATGLAGAGLGATSGVLAVQVSGAVKIASDVVGISGSIAGAGLGYAGGVDSISELQVKIRSGYGIGIASDELELDLGALGASLNAAGLTKDDFVPMWDADGGRAKKLTVEDQATFYAGAANGGITAANGLLSVDLGEFATEQVADGDFFAFIDATDGSMKKEAIADLATLFAGDGLVANSSVLAVNVDDSSIETNSDAIRVKALGITNAMLAGSIANAKLANSAVTLNPGPGLAAIGSVSLGGSVSIGVDGVLEDLDTLGAAGSDGQFIVATGAGTFAYESGATVRTSLGLGTGDSPTFTNMVLSGDLTVNGTTTSLHTNNLTVKDQMIMIGSGSQGSGQSKDMGLVFRTGNNQKDHGLIYDKSVQEFAFIKEATNNDLMDENATDMVIDAYAIVKAGTYKADLFEGDLACSQQAIGNADGTLIAGVNYGSANTTQLRTWTLPASPVLGHSVKVKAPAGVHADGIKILKAGSQTIDGETFILLESPHAAVELVYVANNLWKVF